MMIRAYSELYLDDAMQNLGDMLDYAVNDCGYDPDTFFGWFISCGIAESFGSGNPKYISGMSGVELAREVVYQTKGIQLKMEATQSDFKDAVFWAGWSLAYYQWIKGQRFKDIIGNGLTISTIISMYILHEADISKFVESADQVILRAKQDKPTRLQMIRKARGYTQAQLAEASGVALRMVQLYEQRRSDINSASVDAVLRLSRALGCKIEDLLEMAVNAE